MDRSENWHSHLWKWLDNINLSWHIPTLWPSNSTSRYTYRNEGICSPNVRYKKVQSSVIHNSPNVEKPQMSINRIDKQVLRSISTMESDTEMEMKMNELQLHTISWINFANIILNENKPNIKEHILFDSVYLNLKLCHN